MSFSVTFFTNSNTRSSFCVFDEKGLGRLGMFKLNALNGGKDIVVIYMTKK